MSECEMSRISFNIDSLSLSVNLRIQLQMPVRLEIIWRPESGGLSMVGEQRVGARLRLVCTVGGRLSSPGATLIGQSAEESPPMQQVGSLWLPRKLQHVCLR